jgi:hypothetical protein
MKNTNPSLGEFAIEDFMMLILQFASLPQAGVDV